MTQWNEARHGNKRTDDVLTKAMWYKVRDDENRKAEKPPEPPDISQLSGQKIPNQAERDAGYGTFNGQKWGGMMNVPADPSDEAQTAMDNAAADKGAAEWDYAKPIRDYIRNTFAMPLEDVVSGTARPNETAKGIVYRLIKTWNEDALIIKLVDGEMRDLAAYIAKNLEGVTL